MLRWLMPPLTPLFFSFLLFVLLYETPSRFLPAASVNVVTNVCRRQHSCPRRLLAGKLIPVPIRFDALVGASIVAVGAVVDLVFASLDEAVSLYWR